MSNDLIIIPELTNQGLVVHIVGEVFLDTAPAMREALKTVLTSGHYGRVIADLREIVVMDSSGLAALIHARKSAPDACELCVLVTLGSQPHRLFAAAKLMDFLNVLFDMNILTELEDVPVRATATAGW